MFWKFLSKKPMSKATEQFASSFIDAQVAQIMKPVMLYIEEQRQKYLPVSCPLTRAQRLTLEPFFPPSVLESARLAVLEQSAISNPPFYSSLKMMGYKNLPDFSKMRAVTFIDVIVTREKFTMELIFHELAHVTQYQKLGLREFVARYVRGFLREGSCNAIPVEVHAYEMERRFCKNPAAFSVESDVQRWIDENKF